MLWGWGAPHLRSRRPTSGLVTGPRWQRCRHDGPGRARVCCGAPGCVARGQGRWVRVVGVARAVVGVTVEGSAAPLPWSAWRRGQGGGMAWAGAPGAVAAVHRARLGWGWGWGGHEARWGHEADWHAWLVVVAQMVLSARLCGALVGALGDMHVGLGGGGRLGWRFLMRWWRRIRLGVMRRSGGVVWRIAWLGWVGWCLQLVSGALVSALGDMHVGLGGGGRLGWQVLMRW